MLSCSTLLTPKYVIFQHTHKRQKSRSTLRKSNFYPFVQVVFQDFLCVLLLVVLCVLLSPYVYFSYYVCIAIFTLDAGLPGVFFGGKKRPVRKADNFTTIPGHCHVIWEP